MAMDKSRTSPIAKALIILLALSFVIGIGGLSVVSSCSSNAPLLPGQSTASTASSTTTTESVAAINAKWQPQIQARETSLTAEPKNYNLLIAQGQSYFDWAVELQQSKNDATAGQEQWRSAVPYYRRALSIKPGDPNVTTDYSVTVYYSGDATQAVSIAETVRRDNPKFSPVLYNLAIFYASSGNTAQAKTDLEAYLKLDPNGQNATAAKQMLTQLGSSK